MLLIGTIVAVYIIPNQTHTRDMNKTIEEIRNAQSQIRIPNLDTMYEDVCEFVKAHQGEKGYIDTQSDENDTIYCFVYEDYSGQGEERIVYGVRWNEEDGDLEICYEPFMRTYRVVYDDDVFRGKCEDKDANAEWVSVKWSDIYYIPTIFSIAESIWEYVE